MPIFIRNRQKQIRFDLRRLRKSAAYLLRHLKCADYEMSVLFVDDEAIREINRKFLNRDRSTNVIAFSMLEGEGNELNQRLLGDIIISVETARNDAEAENITLDDELEFLMIHGILHLVGYEHENTSAEKAEEMKELNSQLFFDLRGYRLSS